MRMTGCLFVAVNVAAITGSCLAGPVTLSQSSPSIAQSSATSSQAWAVSPTLSPTVLPYADSGDAASPDGSAAARGQLAMTAERFVSTASLRLAGATDGDATWVGSLNFLANSSGPFQIGGSIDWTGSPSSAGIATTLYDRTTSTYLSSFYHLGEGAGPQQLVLGTGGGTFNSTSGALSGQLVAGHQYEWLFFFQTTGSTADATGEMFIDFNPAVPLPNPAGLAMAGLVAIIAPRRRRKH